MKNTYQRAIILLVLFFGFLIQIQAQYEVGQHYKINTTDAGTIIGTYVEGGDTYMTIETASLGQVTIQFSSIRSIKEIDGDRIIDGKYWFENPNATRNLYSPTAYGLRKGEGYFQNTWIVLNTVSYGFTDWFSMGAGMELISVFYGGTKFPAFVITPKVSFPIVEDKWNVGGGALYVNATGLAEDTEAQFGIVYGVGTYGTRDNNVTYGMGWAYSAYDGFANRPTATISGNYRIARSFGLVSENWFVPIEDKYYGVFSLGARYMAERASIDLAFVFFGDGGSVYPIPWLGVVLPFGGK